MNERSPKNILYKPTNLSVDQTVDKVMRHHSLQTQRASRLPVLAIHSAMSIIAQEFERYEGCTVLTPKYRAIAKSRKDLIANVHIFDANDMLFEGYAVKHNICINSRLIQAYFEKILTTTARRFYILTTHQRSSYIEFEPEIQRIDREHGRELIVDGVYPTLRRYLRLMGSTSEFVDAYATHLETDPSVTFQIKEAWNEIVAS